MNLKYRLLVLLLVNQGIARILQEDWKCLGKVKNRKIHHSILQRRMQLTIKIAGMYLCISYVASYHD